MTVLFAANALWWAYRVGATIARGYLGWEAARRGTTLERAFLRAEKRDLSGAERALVDFVKFNDQFAWTTIKDVIIDTSAVATAGAGLLAKLGLGKRIAAVGLVKTAGISGALIDGLIDFTGSVLRGGLNPADAITDVLNLAGRTQKAIQPITNAGEAVVDATVKLGSIIAPFLSPQARVFPLLAAVPTIINAGVDLFASVFSFWGVVEPVIEDLGGRRPPAGVGGTLPAVDPVFREALRRQGEEARVEPPKKPPRPPREKGDRPTGGLPTRIDGRQFLNAPEVPHDRQMFFRRFSRIGIPDIRRIIEELKRG